MDAITIRELSPDDVAWAEETVAANVGGRQQVRRGQAIDALSLPGFVAERAGRPVGLLTFRDRADESELVLLAVSEPGSGIGSALIEAWFSAAAGAARLWVVTTNDNLDALRFYQRHGLMLAALRPRAVDHGRRIKPAIPITGAHGIPMRDELELERLL